MSSLLQPTLPGARVRPGDRLGAVEVPVTPTFVVSTALATRDFQDVHHDRDLAQSRGSADIFLNILTTTGLVQRFVTDWAGPEALVRGVSVRLGAPCYPYDTLRLTGEVTDVESETVDGADRRAHVVTVTGTTDHGRHVLATVRIELAAGEAR